MFNWVIVSLSLVISISCTNAAKCLYSPIGYIPTGCNVGNLTITSATGNIINTDWKCNQTVDSIELDYPPSLKFTNFPHAPVKNQTYVMVTIDKTSNQLLWMVSNITAVDRVLVPGKFPWYGQHKNNVLLKSYEAPSLNATSSNHSIEFLIFEERNPGRIHLSYTDFDRYHKFYLREWLQRQAHSGIIFCGPVGGGQLTVRKRFAPYPTQGYHTPPPYGQPTYNPPYPNPNPQGNNNFHYPNYPANKGSYRKNQGTLMAGSFFLNFSLILLLIIGFNFY